MNDIQPKEFKIKLSFKDGKMRADFEQDGECAAFVSEPMTGNLQVDLAFMRNMEFGILDVVMERFYPPFKVPYKFEEAEAGDRAILDQEMWERNKTEHAERFGREAR